MAQIIAKTYLIFVIFCTPAHIEAWKKYAKKCVNSRQNPSCNKTAEFHFGEYLLFEWLYLVLGWYVWYFKSTNIAQSQETSLNTVPLAFLAENCTPAWKKYASTAGGAGDKYQLCSTCPSAQHSTCMVDSYPDHLEKRIWENITVSSDWKQLLHLGFPLNLCVIPCLLCC